MLNLIVLVSMLSLPCGASLGPRPDVGESRIIGGGLFDIADVPWQAAIHFDSTGKAMFTLRCGGTIISYRTILTSAQCTFGPTGLMKIRIGSSSQNYGGTLYWVERVLNYPEFNSNTKDLDVALIFTQVEMSLGSTARIAKLPDPSFVIPADSEGFTSGWGSTTGDLSGSRPSELYKTNLTVIDKEECANTYAGYRTISASMFCARGAHNTGVCDGDMGGPFVLDGVVVGITSWNRVCGSSPDVFTSVPFVMSWINANII